MRQDAPSNFVPHLYFSSQYLSIHRKQNLSQVKELNKFKESKTKGNCSIRNWRDYVSIGEIYTYLIDIRASRFRNIYV